MNQSKEKILDMHTHTNYSDGEYSPDELIKKAVAANIETIAITDHDTLLGVQNITVDPKELGIEVIPGIELSVRSPSGRMHLLGHNLNIWDEKLNAKMSELHNRSLYATAAVICGLKNDYGITFTTEEILAILNKNSNIGRPDVIRLLMKYGYITTAKEGFKKYLDPVYDKLQELAKGLPQEESIRLIKEAGGLASLAHPHTLNMTPEELDTFVGQLVDYGLDGIECFHSNHSPEQIEEYLRLANKYDLLITGGSDYHGPTIKPKISLGTGKDNLKLKQLTLVDKIHHINK